MEFTQTEVVETKLDGTLMTVDGDGRDRADPNRSVHSAFALASFDPAANRYQWTAFSNGSRIETELLVGESHWQWFLRPVPQVTVRYTARFTPQGWREVGEISLDGGRTWRQNLDMNLRRVG